MLLVLSAKGNGAASLIAHDIDVSFVMELHLYLWDVLLGQLGLNWPCHVSCSALFDNNTVGFGVTSARALSSAG